MILKSLAYAIGEYMKKHILNITAYILFLLIFSFVFYLYSLNIDAVLYAFLLSAIVALIFVAYDFSKYYKQHLNLFSMKNKVEYSVDDLPYPRYLLEDDYQNLLIQLNKRKEQLESNSNIERNEMLDYYTLWVHQIKTPISAMRLLIQSEDGNLNKDLSVELFKIEQYVEMVLTYLRMRDMSSDLNIKSISLSKIIRFAIRKYSSIFILRKIKLEFEEPDCMVLTDEKWLEFVIEQILSNALKYTSEGKIYIYMDKDYEKTLVIEDTGIGIRTEDLPRVFEKGFTGCNGRQYKKSTGIGLYLCKNILSKLSHSISITSEISKGTKVSIDLANTKINFD